MEVPPSPVPPRDRVSTRRRAGARWTSWRLPTPGQPVPSSLLMPASTQGSMPERTRDRRGTGRVDAGTADAATRRRRNQRCRRQRRGARPRLQPVRVHRLCGCRLHDAPGGPVDLRPDLRAAVRLHAGQHLLDADPLQRKRGLLHPGLQHRRRLRRPDRHGLQPVPAGLRSRREHQRLHRRRLRLLGGLSVGRLLRDHVLQRRLLQRGLRRGGPGGLRLRLPFGIVLHRSHSSCRLRRELPGAGPAVCPPGLSVPTDPQQRDRRLSARLPDHRGLRHLPVHRRAAERRLRHLERLLRRPRGGRCWRGGRRCGRRGRARCRDSSSGRRSDRRRCRYATTPEERLRLHAGHCVTGCVRGDAGAGRDRPAAARRQTPALGLRQRGRSTEATAWCARNRTASMNIAKRSSRVCPCLKRL